MEDKEGWLGEQTDVVDAAVESAFDASLVALDDWLQPDVLNTLRTGTNELMLRMVRLFVLLHICATLPADLSSNALQASAWQSAAVCWP